jgi:hypothetical protein
VPYFEVEYLRANVAVIIARDAEAAAQQIRDISKAQKDLHPALVIATKELPPEKAQQFS